MSEPKTAPTTPPRTSWPRQQALAWLGAVDRAAATLSAGVEVGHRRRSLEEIITGGRSILTGLGADLQPDVLADIHVVVASALVDAAYYEEDADIRVERITAAVEEAETAAEIALESETAFVPAEVLPAVLGLLAIAIRLGLPGRRGYLERRVALFAGDLAEALERTAAETSRGGELLIEAGILRDAASAPDVVSSERRQLLEQAQVAAVEARDLFFSAGNGELTRLALTCAREVIADLAAVPDAITGVLTCGSCGSAVQPNARFCSRCGARVST